MLLALVMLLCSSVDVRTEGLAEVARPSRAAANSAAAHSAAFSYDAVDPNNRRKAAAVKHGSEDLLLDPAKRSKLTANARDIARNFAIARWMIAKHLDYVATFEFHCRTRNDAIDVPVEAFMQTWSRPYNCDAAGRHRFPKMIRLAEARRVIDGDVGLLKLADGRLQAIEGDRIRDPLGQGPFLPREPGTGTKWIHGVKCDEAGRALAYAIHRRTGMSGYEFERTVSAANLCLHGAYERFDQVRGVSPLAAALNPLRDTYEAVEYALLKAKVTQLFALTLFRQADESGGEIARGVDADGNEDKSGYSVDFGKGPILLDLEPGDDAKFLESQSPSTQFQEFTQVAITIAMKALDLPFSFYNEAHTNFFGSRAAWLHYERSCIDKRADLNELLTRITLWRLALAIADGDVVLPAGATLADVHFEWVPLGMPWWDPAKEIRGDLEAIGAGLDNPQRITKERGRGDFYDNVDAIADARKYAESKGVTLSFAPSSPATPEVEVVER